MKILQLLQAEVRFSADEAFTLAKLVELSIDSVQMTPEGIASARSLCTSLRAVGNSPRLSLLITTNSATLLRAAIRDTPDAHVSRELKDLVAQFGNDRTVYKIRAL